MITNFKVFENVENKKYWLVRCDYPFLEISLYKLNASKEIIDWYSNINKWVYEKNYKNIYIAPFDGDPKWNVFNTSGKKDFENVKYVFQGKLKITPEDIEDWKLKKKSYKYNL
jgi:hypothetical protein